MRYVNRVFSELETAKTELRQSVMLQGQHVSLACVASTQWVDMITAFSQENPHFTLLCTSISRPVLAGSGLSAQHSFLLAAEDDIPMLYADKLDSTLFYITNANLLLSVPNNTVGSLLRSDRGHRGSGVPTDQIDKLEFGWMCRGSGFETSSALSLSYASVKRESLSSGFRGGIT